MMTDYLRTARTASARLDDAVEALFAESCSTVPIQVEPLSGRPDGARIISSPTASLIIGVGPVGELNRIYGRPEFGGAAAYTCLSHGTISMPGAELRPGETSDARRRGKDHLANPPCVMEQMLCVVPKNQALFGKDACLALQYLLYWMAQRAGRGTLIGAPPQRPFLLDHAPQILARWAADLRPMLLAAGTPLFEPRGEVAVPPRPTLVSETDLDGVAPARGYELQLPRDLTGEANLYELMRGPVVARAAVIGPWTILLGGSFIARETCSGVQSCIAVKRDRMALDGILQRLGNYNMLRLVRDVALPSLTNAARVVTGSNDPGTIWRPL